MWVKSVKSSYIQVCEHSPVSLCWGASGYAIWSEDKGVFKWNQSPPHNNQQQLLRICDNYGKLLHQAGPDWSPVKVNVLDHLLQFLVYFCSAHIDLISTRRQWQWISREASAWKRGTLPGPGSCWLQIGLPGGKEDAQLAGDTFNPVPGQLRQADLLLWGQPDLHSMFQNMPELHCKTPLKKKKQGWMWWRLMPLIPAQAGGWGQPSLQSESRTGRAVVT